MWVVAWEELGHPAKQVEVRNEATAEATANQLVRRGIHRAVFYEIDPPDQETR